MEIESYMPLGLRPPSIVRVFTSGLFAKCFAAISFHILNYFLDFEPFTFLRVSSTKSLSNTSFKSFCSGIGNGKK